MKSYTTPYTTESIRSRPHRIPPNTEIPPAPAVPDAPRAGPPDAIAALLPLARENLVDGPAQLGGREGLQQDVVEAQPRRLVDDVGGAVGGHQHAGHVRADLARLLEDLEAVHTGHLVVDHEEVEGLLADQLDRGLAAVRGADRVAEGLQPVHAEDDDRPRVVDDQDLRLGRVH